MGNDVLEEVNEEISDQPEETSSENEIYNNQVNQIAHDIYEEIINNANSSESVDSSDGTPIDDNGNGENVNGEVTQNDYSQQLSDLYAAVYDLRSGFDDLSQSQLDLQSAVETTPEQIRSEFDDIIQFQYLCLSLIFGLLIAIIFFKGLKK